MIRLGCIADDYTGASDLAGVLRDAGLRTVQTIGVPGADLSLDGIDAVVVALKSRSIEPERAVAQSLEACRALRADGADHILFKICSTFDSTDRGNIGPVIDALRRETGAGAVPVNPSFIENRRSVYQGHLFVGDVLLSESPLKDHPLNPMHDPNLVRVLGRQSSEPVSLITLDVVEQGADAIAAALAGSQGSVIVDAVAPRHLDMLGEAALGGVLSCGASGIGRGLARAIVARDGFDATRATVDRPPALGPHAAILAGSCSRATLGQIAAAEASMPTRGLDVERLLAGEDEVGRALEWALERLVAGPVLIFSSAEAAEIRRLQAEHGGEATGHAVEQALARIAEALVENGVGRLIVAGGETSGAVVDRLGLQAFLIGAEIAPGVPALTALGRRHAGLALALKSGNFGAVDFFATALRALED
jgi:uncharacterized protein YgbK (DUF1537 family)